MTEHDTLVELIPLVALGALEAAEEHRVVWHARSCEQCGPELSRYERVTAALIPDRPAPRHLWDGIVAAIEAPSCRHRSAGERARPGPRGWNESGAVGDHMVEDQVDTDRHCIS